MKTYIIVRDNGEIQLSPALHKTLIHRSFVLVKGTDENYYIIPVEADEAAANAWEYVDELKDTFQMQGVAVELLLKADSEAQEAKIETSKLGSYITTKTGKIKCYLLKIPK